MSAGVPSSTRPLYLAQVLKDGPRQHRHHVHADMIGEAHPHRHQHQHRHQEDVGADSVPRLPKRAQMSVPYSTLQAMLFRCTAARNGCLSSKNAYSDVYPVRRLGRSWSVHNATSNRAATL